MPPAYRKRSEPPPSRVPRLLTIKEVGDRFGVSHDTVRRWVIAGDLAVVDVGGKRPRLRVTEKAVAEFIAARTIKAS